MCRCLDKVTTCLLKLINLVLLVLGLGAVGYSVYLSTLTVGTTGPITPPHPGGPNLTIVSNGSNGTVTPPPGASASNVVFPAVVGGMGGVMSLLSLALLLCGHRKPCFLTMYCLSMSLVVVGQISAASLFLMPSTQHKLLDMLHLNATEVAFLTQNLKIVSYAFIGVASLETVAVLFAWCHRNYLIDEREYGGDEYGSNAKTSLLRRSKVEMGDQASERRRNQHRSKYADLYKKYNIDSGAEGP